MSSTKLNLPFKRFVAQVSTGSPRSKSSFLSLMAENLESLQTCPWREADSAVGVTLTGHDLTAPTQFSDAYDAFKLTGNYDASAMTEVAYAGMAAYRFTVPASALGSGSEVAISSVSLPVSRDRYLKGGVRIAYELSDRGTPSTDWSIIRGGGAPAAAAYLENTADYLTASQPSDGTVDVDLSGVSSDNPAQFLWVYVTLEDYTDWWDKYSANEARQYAIEGSAMLVGGSVEVTFAGDVTTEDQAVVLLDGGSSPTWLQPLQTVNVGVSAPPVPSGEPLVESFFTGVQREKSALTYTFYVQFNTSFWTGSVVFKFSGKTFVSASVTYNPSNSSTNYTGSMTYSPGQGYLFVSSFQSQISYLVVRATGISFQDVANDEASVVVKIAEFSAYDSSQQAPGYKISGTSSSSGPVNYTATAFDVDSYYIMLQLSDGVPSDADLCDEPNVESRRNVGAQITGSSSPWSVELDDATYTVTESSQTFTLKNGATTLGTWTSAYSGVTTFFDPAVAAWLNNQTVQDFGIAAALGDFSAAVATFEAGTQPDDSELLGRLARMSRQEAGDMAYMAPKVAALADEVDVLRPVPRFFRVSGSAPTQAACQPGLSAWYYRPPTGSSASGVVLWRGEVTSGVKVANPVFLQLAVLALRAPSLISQKIVLTNVGEEAVANPFTIRFVAWASPANQWDGSNGFAMAAMGSMPSIFSGDGPDELFWEVEATGNLMQLGSRQMSARRVGISSLPVSGDIAENSQIEIPLADAVGKGDVVIIAPEIRGFASTSAANAYFGRQADPAGSDAESHNFAWARYQENLGWFPRVTGI